MAVKDTDILDLLKTTDFEEHKNKWEFLAPQLQDYIFFNMMSKRQNVKMQTGGMGLEKTLLTGSGASSRWVGLFDSDQVNIQDLLKKMRVEWKHITDACAYERREFNHNSGKYIINDVIKPRRQDCMLRMIETLEESFFGVPDPDEANLMLSLFYWIVPDATQGFNGGLPNYSSVNNDFSSIAGVNLDNVPSFKNWTDTYSAVTKDDLIAKMRKAFRRTRWRSPISASEFTSETGTRRMIYTTESVLEEMERIGEDQNENLGRDLASMDGNILFKKTPVVWVPQFDDEGHDYNNAHNDIASPIVMADLDSFFVFVDSQDNFYKTEQKDPKCHNQFNEFYDLSLNTFCANRRSNAILTYSS